MLLVWAKGCVFAHLNQLPLVTSSWWGFRWGTIKRNEKKKRFYWGYFNESSLIARSLTCINILFYEVIREPPVKQVEQGTGNKKVFLFNSVITNQDLFGEIRPYRQLVKDKLYGMLTPLLQHELNNYPVTEIAVHIRRGDFKMGNPVTPESFFIDCIKQVRSVCGKEWEVTVFTDAENDEIQNVLALTGVSLAKPKPDILDILLMSKSKVIVLSQSSTFSYWAAFLSNAVVLKPANDWQNEIRSQEINAVTPEIRWIPGDQDCIQLLKRSFDNN